MLTYNANTKFYQHFIEGFITCWTLVEVPSNFISVFLQHVEPLSAQVWQPSVFAEEAAVEPERNNSLQLSKKKKSSL